MRKPRPAVYVFGNSVSALAILGGSCFMGYAWWTGQVQGDWIPLAAFCASGAAVNANEKLTTYQVWKESWDLMGGARPRRGDRLAKLACLAIWAGIAVVMARLDYHHQPLHVFGLVCFLGATAIMLRRLFPRKPRAVRQQRPSKVAIVTVLAAVPRHSPSVAQARHALPAYCAGLLS